jgi:glycosyltransferase involved in cell wall biosynthesis
VFKRIFIAPIVFFLNALKKKADVYHFHDPELIITGLALRVFGKKVIYDIHEDYTTSINHRGYIPVFLKKIVSILWSLFEKNLASFFQQVIAENYYQKRFPKALPILNYPIISEFEIAKNINGIGNTLLYTGNINEERGALIQTNILNYVENIKIVMIGYCLTSTWNKMRFIAAPNLNKLKVIGINSYIPFSEIKNTYNNGTFLCGLAIFPESPHFREKELTKFFEYMQFGIPIICSNFPVWKNLVEKNDCGICVNPNLESEIKNAIVFLQENPDRAKEMSENGIKNVKNQFNWTTESEKLIELYNSLVTFI